MGRHRSIEVRIFLDPSDWNFYLWTGDWGSYGFKILLLSIILHYGMKPMTDVEREAATKHLNRFKQKKDNEELFR